MTDRMPEDRLRNTRAWAAARVGSLSGAEVIVSAIDELLELRRHHAMSPEQVAACTCWDMDGKQRQYDPNCPVHPLRPDQPE